MAVPELSPNVHGSAGANAATGASGAKVITKTRTHPYELMFDALKARREQSKGGTIVLRGADRPWQTSRQGRSKYYIHTQSWDAPTTDWMVFRKEIHTESGAHTHQGGLIIYVLRGRGYSVFDGERIDWTVGDILVLPIKPGGVEHQHFNEDPSGSSEWIAFVFLPFFHATGSMMTQIKDQRGWREDADAVAGDTVAGDAVAGDTSAAAAVASGEHSQQGTAGGEHRHQGRHGHGLV